MKRVKSLNKYDDVKLAEIKYGLEGFYLTITKIIIIILLSIIFNTEKYTLLFLTFSFPIRAFSYGFHANKSIQCLIISIWSFVIFPLIAKFITFNRPTLILIYSLLLIGYFILSPKDTEKKPMRNNKNRLRLKILSMMVVLIYMISSFFITSRLINNLIIFALFNQLIMISPIPFIMFKQKYNFKWFK